MAAVTPTASRRSRVACMHMHMCMCMHSACIQPLRAVEKENLSIANPYRVVSSPSLAGLHLSTYLPARFFLFTTKALKKRKYNSMQNTTFGSLLIANPVSSSPTGMFVRATYTENGGGHAPHALGHAAPRAIGRALRPCSRLVLGLSPVPGLSRSRRASSPTGPAPRP